MRPRRTRLLGAALCLVLLGGCGLQRDHADVVAAARLAAGVAQSAAAAPSGHSPSAATPGPSPGAAATDADSAGPSTGSVAPTPGVPTSGRATPTGGGGAADGSAAATGAGAGPAASAAGKVPTAGAKSGVGPSTPAPSAPGPNGAAPPTAGRGEPIRIGGVGTLSGPAGALLRDANVAVQVWAQAINSRGGINGHPVEYILGDNGADPARHRALVQEFVEKRGVIAFVQNQEGLVGPSAAEYPTRKRVPVINTEGGDNYPYDSPMYFPTAPTGDELAFAMVAAFGQVAIPENKTKLGIVYCEIAACKNFDRVWSSDRAKKLGFTPVYRAMGSLAQPDYTSECLGARQAGVQMMAIGMDNNSIGRFAASCKRQGFTPLYGISSNTALPNVRQDPNLDGAVVGTHTFAWPATDTPARKEFHDLFTRFAPGVEINGSHAVGWTAAKAFEAAAAARIGPGDHPTSELVLQGLWTFNGNDLGGLTYPLRFTAEQPAKRRACWSVVRIRDSAWVAGSDGGVQCETPGA